MNMFLRCMHDLVEAIQKRKDQLARDRVKAVYEVNRRDFLD